MVKSLLALAAAAAVLGGFGDAPLFPNSCIGDCRKNRNRRAGEENMNAKSHENKAKSEANALKGAEANKDEGGDLLSPDLHEVEGGDLLSVAAAEVAKTERAAVRVGLQQELSRIQLHLDNIIERQHNADLAFLSQCTSATLAGTARFATRVRKAMVAVQESGKGELMEPFLNQLPLSLVPSALTLALKYNKLLMKYNEMPLDHHFGEPVAPDAEANRKRVERVESASSASLERVEKGERENLTPKSISKEDLEAYHQSWAHLGKVKAGCDLVEKQLTRNLTELGQVWHSPGRGPRFARRFRVSIRQIQFHGDHGELERLRKAPKWGEWAEEPNYLIDAAISYGEDFYDRWMKLQDAEKEADKKLDSLVSHDEIRRQLLSRISGHQLEARTHVKRLKNLAAMAQTNWTLKPFDEDLDKGMNQLMDDGKEGVMLDLLRKARSSEEELMLGGAIDAGRAIHAAQKELQSMASEN